jgi:group I intron endonuclease
MKSGIYVIKNKANGKVYVGQSTQLNQRYSGHLRRIKKGTHHNEILQKSFYKYGFDNFEFSILEEVLEETLLNEREKYWIDFYGGINNDNVYNLKDPLLNEYSEYVRKKISQSNAGVNNPNYGNKWTDEMKEKVSKLKKGITLEERIGKEKSDFAKEKLREINFTEEINSSFCFSVTEFAFKISISFALSEITFSANNCNSIISAFVFCNS